jgi:hypothetical protein
MTLLTIPRVGIPLVSGTTVSPEWYRYFHDLGIRAGGVDGAGTDDLSASAFEDAGIPEQQAQIYTLSDAVGQAPVYQEPLLAEKVDPDARIEALEAQVAELTKALEGLMQEVKE